MRPNELRTFLLRVGAGSLVFILTAGVLFGAGIWAGRKWFPRVEIIRVDHEVVKAIPIPGETRVITVTTPGPTQVVRIPIEVTRIIERPGQDRIVTVTKPVEVPVEVVRREWPQTITVRVGSVLTKEYGWATPMFPDLLIGLVTPGVFAVPVQEGWKIETVTTETKVPTAPPPSPPWRVEIRPGFAVVASPSLNAGVAVNIDAAKDRLVVNGTIGYGLNGPFGLVFVGWRF